MILWKVLTISIRDVMVVMSAVVMFIASIASVWLGCRGGDGTIRFKAPESEEPGMAQVVVVRKITQEGLEFIKRFEGFSAVVYRCSAGFQTVGYGHEVLKGEKFAVPITEEQALEILARDVMIAERSVCRLINVPLEDWHYDALTSFTYNLGGGALQVSTLRQLVLREEHASVPEQFRRWVYAGGRKLNGLIRRRNAEATMYAGG
jgi:lysozyme